MGRSDTLSAVPIGTGLDGSTAHIQSQFFTLGEDLPGTVLKDGGGTDEDSRLLLRAVDDLLTPREPVWLGHHDL